VPAWVSRPETVTRNHLKAWTPGECQQLAPPFREWHPTFYDADLPPFIFEDGTLLDVQLEVRCKRVVAVRRLH
jgi:hypothetical protein